MTRRKKGRTSAHAALWLGVVGAAALLSACPGTRHPAAAPVTPAEPAPAAAGPPAAEPAATPAPIEAGFTYCCGNGSYRMEVMCGDMLKRCYQNVAGTWHQTYGHYCRDQLGDDCFLQDCEARCE